MYNPCKECYMRYNKEYSDKCDCDYAELYKKLHTAKLEIEKLLSDLEG